MTKRYGFDSVNKYTLLRVDEEGLLHVLGPRKGHYTLTPIISRKYRRCAQCGARIDTGDPIWYFSCNRGRTLDRICDPCVQLVEGYRRGIYAERNPAEAHKPADRVLKKYPLIEHAYRELDIAGMFAEHDEETEIGSCILRMIEVLARYDLTARGAFDLTLKLFWDLAHTRPISGLTTDPAEWVDWSALAGRPLWRNVRDTEAFSEDAGRTFYRLSDILRRRLQSRTRSEYIHGIRNDGPARPEPQPEPEHG